MLRWKRIGGGANEREREKNVVMGRGALDGSFFLERIPRQLSEFQKNRMVALLYTYVVLHKVHGQYKYLGKQLQETNEKRKKREGMCLFSKKSKRKKQQREAE